MNITEQLIELVGQKVILDGIPTEEYFSNVLSVKQDYQYKVDWIEFISDEVSLVLGNMIYFTPERKANIIDAIIEINPHFGLDESKGPDYTQLPEYVYYQDHPAHPDDVSPDSDDDGPDFEEVEWSPASPISPKSAAEADSDDTPF